MKVFCLITNEGIVKEIPITSGEFILITEPLDATSLNTVFENMKSDYQEKPLPTIIYMDPNKVEFFAIYEYPEKAPFTVEEDDEDDEETP